MMVIEDANFGDEYWHLQDMEQEQDRARAEVEEYVYQASESIDFSY